MILYILLTQQLMSATTMCFFIGQLVEMLWNHEYQMQSLYFMQFKMYSTSLYKSKPLVLEVTDDEDSSEKENCSRARDATPILLDSSDGEFDKSKFKGPRMWLVCWWSIHCKLTPEIAVVVSFRKTKTKTN